MKKIALISVHNDPNYGSALQAYALAYAIKREGYDCEYISYSPFKQSHGFVPWLKRCVNTVLYGLGIRKYKKTEYYYWATPQFKKQKKLFAEFHDSNIPFSKETYDHTTIKESNNQYDCFIVGSDQTWSPYVTQSEYTINFLDFVEPIKIKGSYAPSLGTCHLPEDYITKLKEKVVDFKFLSCREKQNAELLTERLGRKVEHVLDPTLLLNNEEWLQIAEPLDMPKKYVLCYILGTKQCISDFAEQLGNKESLPVYYIVSRPEYTNKKNALQNITPGQFISLIAGATFIVTDSFHGSLFSVNFCKQFFAFSKRAVVEGRIDNDRIGDFLSVLGLQERLIDDTDRYDLSRHSGLINYEIVVGNLIELKSKSKGYLQNMLNTFIIKR